MSKKAADKIVRGPSGLKKRIFFALMVLVPVLFFVLLEAGLRLAGYGGSYPLFVPVDGYPDYLRPGDDVARRYFESFENVPGIPFDSFRARKDSGAFRIFIQGGSSAAGFPYYFGGSFPDMLEQRLLQTFPGKNIEVINTAMAAVNSYTLADFTEEIIAHDPNLVLIYAGHNEYYGALGVGSSESLGRSPFVVRLYLRIRGLRLVQGLRALLGKAASVFGGGIGPGANDTGGTLMERMVGEQRIPFASELYQAGLRQFEFNLADILGRYRRAGIPVFVGTVVSNERDQRPFISGLSPETDTEVFRAAMTTANERLAAHDTTAALEAIGEAIAIDSLAAVPFFLQAKLHDKPESWQLARHSYKKAKDRDELRFRAPEPINEIIRRTASATAAVVVDTEAAVSSDSRSGIPGANVMTEHLHPNIRGYFLLADAFYEAIRDRELIGDWSGEIDRETARRELLVTPIDSIAGAYRVQALRNGWPFRPIGAPAQPLDTIAAGTLEGRLGLAVFQRSMRRVDALEELHSHYLATNNLTAALQSLYSIIQRYPFLAQPYLAASNVLIRAGRHDEALEYALASIERGPTPEAHRTAGSLLIKRERVPEAIPHLEAALASEPDNLQTLYNLAGAYALTGRYDRSRIIAARILERYPDHTDTRRLLGSLPK